MGARDDARHQIAQARERLTDLAEEFARRASPDYLRARTKEAALRKSTEIKDRAMDSPSALGVLGGLIGAGIGMAVARRSRSRMREVYEDARVRRGYTSPRSSERETHLEPTYPAVGSAEYYREGKGADLGGEFSGRPGFEQQRGDVRERAQEARSQAGERAEQMRSHASEKAEEIKGRLQSKVQDVRESISDTGGVFRRRAGHLRENIPSREEMRRGIQEQPLLAALGTAALGAAAALLLPMTRKEQQVVEPVKQRARESVRAASDRIEERISGEEQAPSSAGDSGREVTAGPESAPRLPGEQPTAPGPILH